MGLPCVSFASGGIPEAVAHEHTGFLAPERDWQAVAHHIDQLLQQPDLWQRFSEAGRQRVKTTFNLHCQGQTLEAIYQAVLDRNSPTPLPSAPCAS